MCLWSEVVSQWWWLFWLILQEHPKKLTCKISDSSKIRISVCLIFAHRESVSDFLLVRGLKINLPRNSLRSLNLFYVSLTRKKLSLNHLCTDWLGRQWWSWFPYQKKLHCWLSQVSYQKKVPTERETQNNHLPKKLNE